MRRRFFSIVIFHLHFISAPQINTAIASLWNSEFDMQFEIIKFLISHEIGSTLRTLQHTILNHPLVGVCLLSMPAIQVLAVEDLDGCSPNWCLTPLQQRSTLTLECIRLAYAAHDSTTKLLSLQCSFEHHILITLLPLWRNRKT